MSEEPEIIARDEALDYVHTVVGASGTSFYWAMRLLPQAKREAMFAVYAFCREVDDIADGDTSPEEKQAALDDWRDAIDQLFEGAPEGPIPLILAEAVETFGLERTDFEAIIDGMEMDARDRVRIADQGELLLYCDRVACAVGRLSNRVFGIAPGTAEPLAAALGTALQLTNVLRDLLEDADLDRLYLPADRLAAHGIEGSAPAEVLDDPRIAAVCGELADLARERFGEAEALLATCPPARGRPAAIMKEIYSRTLDRLVARGWQRLDQPVRLGKAEKMWIAVRHGLA